jgi:hypothetical protein
VRNQEKHVRNQEKHVRNQEKHVRNQEKPIEMAFKVSPAASVGIANRKRFGRSAVRFLPEAGVFSLIEHVQASVGPCSYLFYWYQWSLSRGRVGVA